MEKETITIVISAKNFGGEYQDRYVFKSDISREEASKKIAEFCADLERNFEQ